MEHSARELASLEMEDRFTEMELLSLKHALDIEVLGLRKCKHYAAETEDGQAKELLERNSAIHHRRIDMMLLLLDAPGSVTKQAKNLLQTAEWQGGLHNAGNP
jgi:hypothetical protein